MWFKFLVRSSFIEKNNCYFSGTEAPITRFINTLETSPLLEISNERETIANSFTEVDNIIKYLVS